MILRSFVRAWDSCREYARALRSLKVAVAVDERNEGQLVRQVPG